MSTADRETGQSPRSASTEADIALQGVLVPLVVRPDGERFELVAGFHRLAAARSLELAEVPVVVRDADTGEELVRRQMTWAGLFYVATLRALGTGEYAVTADVVINGVRYQLPGPLLSP